MQLVDLVGVVASASSIFCQLVGIQICMQIVRKGGTDLISPVPFIVYFISACLWTKYGLLKSNMNLTLTNAAGAFLQMGYMFIYYIYTMKKSHFHRIMMVGTIVLFSPLMFVRYTQYDIELAARRMGLICCVMSVCVYMSPMASLRDICRTKSSDSMSFWLVIFNFFSAVCWVMYGYMLQDLYVVTPNSLGFVFGLIQLSLFCIYPSTRHKQKTLTPVLLQQV